MCIPLVIVICSDRGVKFVLSGLLIVLSLCCTLSVYSAEYSYNYWNIGVSLSDRDSDYLTKDLNFFGEE